MTAKDYPVTTPYGYVPGYPLHGGFHQGVDYGCPVGTPVVVNGVTIGLSGNTGYTFGPHLHVGRWVGGAVTNPLNGGFNFGFAVVTEINEDPDNGKYVRVQGDGASWVYLHLSDNMKVKVGQELKEKPMEKWSNGETFNLLYHSVSPEVAKQAEAAGYEGFFGLQNGMDFKTAFYDIINSSQYAFMIADAQKGDKIPQVTVDGIEYVPK